MRGRSLERPRFSPTRPTRWHHPNEGVHNRVGYRLTEQALAHAASRYARGRLIDIGCGSKPWERLFAQHVDEHVGVDHVESARDGTRVDIVAGAYEIPLPDGHADTVLLSSVLEHLERPGDALAEARRLLRPGGHVIITAPLIWPLHEQPRDFYRYTPHGLRFLLEEAGLEVVEIVPLAGAWTTLSIELGYALQNYRKRVLRPLVDGVIRVAQWAAARWEEKVDFQPKFSWSHLAIARKPLEDARERPRDLPAERTPA